MTAWMRIVALAASGALFCAAQSGTSSSTGPATAQASQASASESTTPPPPPAQPAAGPDAGQPAAAPTIPPDSAVPPPRKPDDVQASPSGTPTVDVPEPVPTRKADAAPNKPAETPKNPYVIGPLDVLYVRVWGNGNLTSMYDVQEDGMISVPLVGQIKADGLTVDQLQNLLTTRLNDFINNPEVSVQVTKNNSKKYYVMGNGANRTGPFALNGKLTISEALATAGGFKDFANLKKIYLLRGATKFMFNYKEVIAGKNLKQDIQVENGDKIVVPD